MRKDLHFNIDLTLEPRYTKEFVVKQNDSVNLFIDLKSNGTPISVAEQTPRLYVRKPDGSIMVQGGTDELGDNSIILDANTVIVELKNSALNTTGLCYAELELEDERGTLITQTFIFEVIDRLADVEEAIKAVDDIYLLGEIEKFIIQAKIDMALLKEQIAEGLVKIEEFNSFVVEKSEALQDLIDKALDDITTTTGDISEKGEYYLSNITGLGESYGIQIERLGEEFLLSMSMKADEVLNLIRDERESAIEDITVLVDTSKEMLRMKTYEGMTQIRECVSSEINKIGETAQQHKNAIDEAGANAITAVEDAKDNALEEIEGAKTDAVNTIDAREEEIMKNLESITIDGTGMLDDAVKLAEKRLQAQTVQSLWEVQEKSATEQENLERVSRQEQSNISQKANEQIERVNQAGADMIELVENLDANVEAGLNEINTAIRTGKTEINELSSTQIEKIKAEGEEIISMVENIETITGDHIEKIVKAGETNTNRVENMANSCIREINSVASEQKELIRDAGNEKLEEINAILSVSKEDVEELLETTRQELQTHRTEIATRVNLGKEEIDNLKNNSLVEMTDAKDGLIEEILGAEITLKEDFTQLRDQYLQDIDDRGTMRVDALEKMIDRIDALQEAVEKDLEVSEKRAEMLDNKLVDVDNKMDEVRPILDSLTEMRNICISLQQENATAKENIDTLDFLHVEADVRIVELRRLIELADVVIEARSGNHDEINARLDALEEALAELEIPSIDHLATKEELNKAVKLLDAKIDKMPAMTIKGKVGEGVRVAPELAPNAIRNLKFPESEINNYPEVKHTITIKHLPSASLEYLKVFFFVDLDDSSDGKYVSYNEISTLTFNGMTAGTDYVSMVSTSGNVPTEINKSKKISTINIGSSYHNIIYDFDFNVFDANGEKVLVSKPGSDGISDFNKADEDGYYTIDLKTSSYSNISNAPSLNCTSESVKGYLEVVNKVQTFNCDNGEVFVREIGGKWKSTTDTAIKKNTVGEISLTEGVATPEFFKNLPVDLRYFYKDKYTIMYRKDETQYVALRISKSSSKVAAYISGTLYFSTGLSPFIQVDTYNTETGKWTTNEYLDTSTVSTSKTYVNSKYFTIYHCNFPVYVYKSGFTTDIYQDITTANYEIVETISDFDEATETGFYNVSIKEGDAILNTPFELVDGVINDNLQGILKVVEAPAGIYQELISNDNTRAYTRVKSDDIWSEWKEASTGGNSEVDLSSIYTKDEVDELIGNIDIPEIDLEPYATKEELQEAINNIPEADLSGLATKEELENAVSNIEIPEVDLSEYITKSEVEELLVEEIGEFGNVKMTDFDEFPLDKQPTHPGDAYKWKIQYKSTNNSYHTVFFTKDPTGHILYDDSLLESKGLIRYIIDTEALPSSCAKIYRYSSSWGSNSTYPPYGMDSGNSSYGIAETYYHNFNIYDYNDRDVIRRYDYENNLKPGTVNDANKAIKYERYKFDIGEDDGIVNMPIVNSKGVLINDIANDCIKQEVITADNISYTRTYNGSEWTEWKSSDSVEIDTSNLATKEELETVSNQITELQIPITDKINTFTYTNSDGMPEVYNWTDINGFKVMWIDVKHSEAEYNSGTTGLMMKTLNFPAEAQIFDNIIMANITSYCRSSNNTLSRIVQNAEVISNVSVRGRWRHTDNIPPSIDRFTIMCWGF